MPPDPWLNALKMPLSRGNEIQLWVRRTMTAAEYDRIMAILGIMRDALVDEPPPAPPQPPTPDA